MSNVHAESRSSVPVVTEPATIVVVDDDFELRNLLATYLERAGYQVLMAANGAELDATLARQAADLVVLDVMMPGEDGLSVCKRLRGSSAVPILMLTAVGDPIDRVIGIELGADDYMSKPFLPRELLARVRGLLRRATTTRLVASGAKSYHFADFVLCDADGTLEGPLTGKNQLTGTEYRLLATFVTSPGRVLTRDAISQAVHGRATEAFDRSVDVAVSRMRKRLTADGAPATLIKTVHAFGYMFTGTVVISSK